MKIKDIQKLDAGISNIELEGKVNYVKSPRHLEGNNQKGHYSFWSQFVVIEDDTGKIGCNINLTDEKFQLKKEDVVKVKGKVDEYEDKNGEKQKILRASLLTKNQFFDKKSNEIETSVESQPYAFNELEKKDPMYKKPSNLPERGHSQTDNIWEKKDLRIARECAVKAVTDLVCNKIMDSKHFFSFADTIVKYIYNGAEPIKNPLEKHLQKKKDGTAEDGTAEDGTAEDKLEVKNEEVDLEVADEDLPQDDEKVIKKKVEKAVKILKGKGKPGSSYDNPIPFEKLKKKKK